MIDDGGEHVMTVEDCSISLIRKCAVRHLSEGNCAETLALDEMVL